MFSRWINVRRKSAETALREGRIDEAYERLSTPDALADAANQSLINDLAKPLLARARLHAQAGRYREALDDLDRLSKIGKSDNDATALRERVEAELRQRVERQAERHEAYAKAAGDLRQGRLDSARAAIARIEDARERDQLREELDIRAQRSATLLEQAARALQAGDLPAACRFWNDASTRHGRDSAAEALASQLVPAYRETMTKWFEDGALERFRALLACTGTLRSLDPSLGEFDVWRQLLERAAGSLRDRRFDELNDVLLRLRAANGQARWVQDALALVGGIAQAQERLLSSPLGILDVGFAGAPRANPVGAAVAAAGAESIPDEASAARLDRRPLLLLVDGAGSSVLLTHELVRIGRIGAEVEMPIPSDIQSLHAEIHRDGDDYFLVARGPVRVNHVDVRRALLRDGDRITLSSKVKLSFHKPSAKSATAVLRLSDRCRMSQDVSSVVLFRETCLIGPLPSCHIQTRDADARLVLFERYGRLFARRQAERSAAAPLALDQTQDLGDLRLTVKHYDAGPGAGLA